jgi:RNA polymerase sigma-70 factor (ECF subfamily)
MSCDENAPALPSRDFLAALTAELPRLRGSAMIMTRARADADDLLQSTAMRAIAAHHQFALGTNMRAWLYRIMRNVFVDTVRAPDKAAARLQDVSDEFLTREACQEGRIEMREVLQAIDKLPSVHREALLLYAVEALSYDEIAEIQACAVGTVKSRISRARRQVQAQLSGADEPAVSSHAASGPGAARAASGQSVSR